MRWAILRQGSTGLVFLIQGIGDFVVVFVWLCGVMAAYGKRGGGQWYCRGCFFLICVGGRLGFACEWSLQLSPS